MAWIQSWPREILHAMGVTKKKKIKRWLGSICWYKMIKCPSFPGTEGVLRKLIFTTNVWLNNKLLKCFCLKKKKKNLVDHGNGCVSLYFYPNPQNIDNQWWTMDLKWFWCVSVCSISGNKCSTLVGDINNGRSYACVGARGIWSVLAPSPQFCCDPKNAQI